MNRIGAALAGAVAAAGALCLSAAAMAPRADGLFLAMTPPPSKNTGIP